MLTPNNDPDLVSLLKTYTYNDTEGWKKNPLTQGGEGIHIVFWRIHLSYLIEALYTRICLDGDPLSSLQCPIFYVGRGSTQKTQFQIAREKPQTKMCLFSIKSCQLIPMPRCASKVYNNIRTEYNRCNVIFPVSCNVYS